MVLQKILSSVSDVTGDPSANGAHPRTLKTSHFMAADVALTAGEYTKLGEFIVPAQEAYHWGKGAAKFEANQGYLYIDVRDTAAAPGNEILGSIRLQQRDAQERNIITVFEEEGEVLHGAKSDRTSKQALPLQDGYPKVGHQSKLTIAMNAESSATASTANTEMLIPVTVYPQ